MKSWGLTALVVLLGVGVRLYAVDADPPTWHHMGFFSDEGWWAHNARNKALFGTFVIEEPRDEFNQGIWLAPVFSALVWGSFSLFGVSLWSLRLISVLAAGVGALGLALAADRAVGPRAGPMAALLYLTAPFAWAHSRVGLVEETMNAFVAWTIALWLLQRPLADVGTGVVHVLAFATKSYSTLVGPALIVMELVRPGGRERWHRLGRYGIGLLIGFSAYWWTVYSRYGELIDEFTTKLGGDNFPTSLPAAVRNAVTLPLEMGVDDLAVSAWIRMAPVLAVLFALGLGLTATLRWTALRREPVVVLGILLFLTYAAVLAPMQLKPGRRFMVLLIPQVLIAVWGMSRLRQSAPDLPGWRVWVSTLPLALVAAAFPASWMGSLNRGAVAYLLAIPPILFCLRAGAERVWGLGRWLARHGVTVAVLAFAVVVVPELASPRFTEVEEGRRLARIVGDDLVLGGVADSLLMESTAKTFNSHKRPGRIRYNGDLHERADLRWVLTWTQPGRLFIPDDEELFEGAEMVRESSILPDGDEHRATLYLWRRGGRP